jgi:hypothetical protein
MINPTRKPAWNGQSRECEFSLPLSLSLLLLVCFLVCLKRPMTPPPKHALPVFRRRCHWSFQTNQEAHEEQERERERERELTSRGGFGGERLAGGALLTFALGTDRSMQASSSG